jgi:hypothetical protein
MHIGVFTMSTKNTEQEKLEQNFNWFFDIDGHGRPGEFCPNCDEVHCLFGQSHSWNDDEYCRKCGADGRQ